MKKSNLIKKCILTGFIYTLITCIVQVPLANIILSILNLESNSSIGEGQLPFLLLTVFVVGIAIALFYYLYGYLFKSSKRIYQGLKFASFICLANYIPQVFFLDATKGLKGLLTGGFSVFQIELFDLIILLITVLLMVCYMPYRIVNNGIKKHKFLCKDIIVGILFSCILINMHEIILPIFGFNNMADGLNVSGENRLFFYGVMSIGFILTGSLVSYFSSLQVSTENKQSFSILFGILIWCIFDLTMIPLGFGFIATLMFMIVSMFSFFIINFCNNILNEGDNPNARKL